MRLFNCQSILMCSHKREKLFEKIYVKLLSAWFTHWLPLFCHSVRDNQKIALYSTCTTPFTEKHGLTISQLLVRPP